MDDAATGIEGGRADRVRLLTGEVDAFALVGSEDLVGPGAEGVGVGV